MVGVSPDGRVHTPKGSSRAPGAWPFHPGDLACLLDIAIGEQLEERIARIGAQSNRQMLDHIARIWRDLMFFVIFTHEAYDIPVFVSQPDVFCERELFGHGFVPLTEFNQIALFIEGRQAYGCIHLSTSLEMPGTTAPGNKKKQTTKQQTRACM